MSLSSTTVFASDVSRLLSSISSLGRTASRLPRKGFLLSPSSLSRAASVLPAVRADLRASLSRAASALPAVRASDNNLASDNNSFPSWFNI